MEMLLQSKNGLLIYFHVGRLTYWFLERYKVQVFSNACVVCVVSESHNLFNITDNLPM